VHLEENFQRSVKHEERPRQLGRERVEQDFVDVWVLLHFFHTLFSAVANQRNLSGNRGSVVCVCVCVCVRVGGGG
jgi:hypothetical protein